MLLHSFGGLRRGESEIGELLPPGITETDLLGLSIGPDLDSTTIQACLKELKEQCLYLHFDGARYCFKKDPNITLLVEQEAEAVSRDDSRIANRIKDMIEDRLAGQRAAIVWPEKSAEVPDRDTLFLIAYLSLDFAAQPLEEQRRVAREVCESCGNRTREFRNGLGLAVPVADQVHILRRAVRYLLAVERVRGKSREHNLTGAQRDQLREREATEKTAAESALLKLYGEVWLPSSNGGELSLDPVSPGGRPLQTTLDEKRRASIHQRLTELLTSTHRRVFSTVAPGKIVELFKFGEDEAAEPGIATEKVVAGFFSFLGFPRLLSDEAVRKAIARGVETGLFGYATGRPTLGDDGRYQLDRSRVAFERTVDDDEIDLDSGFLMIPSALPVKPDDPVRATGGGEPWPDPPARQERVTEVRDSVVFGSTGMQAAVVEREIALSFTADRDTLYGAWNALANLADLAGKVSISATAKSENGFDKGRLENGVLEPLRELELIDDGSC